MCEISSGYFALTSIRGETLGETQERPRPEGGDARRARIFAFVDCTFCSSL